MLTSVLLLRALWFAVFGPTFLSSAYLTTFTPNKLNSADFLSYQNSPVAANNRQPIGVESNDYLLKEAMTYGNPSGSEVIMGIALYRNYLRGFKRVVGSLRHFGYDGHIILGVHPLISPVELEYLRSRQVTAYAVNTSVCSALAQEKGTVSSLMRGKCTDDLPDLKIEWGRFELARRWLRACRECTGWAMVMDVRDIYFQDHPVRI